MTWTEHLENLENILLRISEHTDLWQDRTIREIAAAVYDLVKDRAKEERKNRIPEGREGKLENVQRLCDAMDACWCCPNKEAFIGRRADDG